MKGKYHKLLDEIGRMPWRTEPTPKPAPAPRPGPGRPVVHDIPGQEVRSLGGGRYQVAVCRQVYLVEKATIEVRPGGRRVRNWCRWLIGRIEGVLHVFFLGFVATLSKTQRREAAIADGLHRWLDSLIRRAGLDFMAAFLGLLEFKLARR